MDYLTSEFLIYSLFLLISIVFVDIFIDVFNTELDIFLNALNANELIIIFFIFILTILFFSSFYFIYNIVKYSKIYIKNVAFMLLKLIFLMCILKILNYYFLNSDQFILIMNILTFVLLFISVNLFSILFIIIFFRKIGGDPIKQSFKYAQSNFDILLKDYSKNRDCESQEPIVCKSLNDIFNITVPYTDGIEEIKQSFGKELHFDTIINLKTKQSLNEMLDQLAFSIPYYILGNSQIIIYQFSPA